jgi:hypothetical protein
MGDGTCVVVGRKAAYMELWILLVSSVWDGTDTAYDHWRWKCEGLCRGRIVTWLIASMCGRQGFTNVCEERMDMSSGGVEAVPCSWPL